MTLTKVILLLGAAMLLAGNMFATPVTCTALSGPTELNGGIICPQIVVSGGLQVTSITLTLTGSINGSITLTNNGASQQTGDGTSTSTFTVASLPGFGGPTVFSASMTTGPTTLDSHTGQVINGLVSGNVFRTLTDTSVFANYVGAGTFLIPVTTVSGLAASGGGGNFAIANTTSGTINATYDYTLGTIPEPMTFVLMGGGLFALGILRFRKR
jgi:hypothetical protein